MASRSAHTHALSTGIDFHLRRPARRDPPARLREVGGLALIALAVIMALALATWSVQDPSLSHATDAPVRNLLGRPARSSPIC